MAPRTRRVLLILVLLLAVLTILLLVRCRRVASLPPPKAVAVPNASGVTARTAPPAAGLADERLTPAIVDAPGAVAAGAAFRVNWTGPDNPGDYITVVRPTARSSDYGNYRETREGASLELTAPIDAGEWEVRYVTVRSRTILGRVPLTVTATSAVLTAADEAGLGSPVSIAWTGPNNRGDYICIVPKDAPDSQVGNYADTSKGSPLTVAAPVQPGEAEIRYVSAQGRTVLGRRKLTVLAPETSVAAPTTVTAGAKFSVTWKGPANRGDYITVVPRGTPDGQYRNYTDTSAGTPLELTAPMEAGEAEIRYMTGSQARVLARTPIKITAADVTLEAADEVVAGAAVKIAWRGPNNPADYITIVAAKTPDGQYGNYTNTAKGSPLVVTAPMHPGASEIRYMSGQGAKVLARRAVAIVPAQIEIKAPVEATIGGTVTVEWKGPNNAGDYLTLVPKASKDGTALHTAVVSRGSPAKFTLPKESGVFEIRYMSGQGNLVLARHEIVGR